MEDNSIVYDPADVCFISLDGDYTEEFYLDVDMSKVLPPGLHQHFHLDDGASILDEECFPEECIAILEEYKAIGPRIVVPLSILRRQLIVD